MPLLDNFAQQKLQEITKRDLLRKLEITEQKEGIYALRTGKSLISFSSNDYFGLSQHPEVISASIEATKLYGAGAGASRLVTGNHPLYVPLESALAESKHKESALVFGSGYLANLGVITALMGKDDLIIADKLTHACMLDGARLSGAKLLRFPHNSPEKCRELLETNRKHYKHCLILTETIFSMDGDAAPLDALLELCQNYDSWLLADDAHGLSIIPPIESPHLIYSGTLSKGLGSYGGYVAASKSVIDFLVNTARPFIFTTGLPPSTIAAAHKALELLKQNLSLGQKALDNAKHFTTSLNLPEAQSPIVPYIVGEADNALALSQQLKEKGFLVSAIRPPTVPTGTSRLRFTFSSLHEKAMIETLTYTLKHS